uniref:Dickkopf N-terminal cysteine-rich domain-containing protein n=1 Tax=Latimeria chalumnae TaxID=7897 RepID=H3AP48_LATCH
AYLFVGSLFCLVSPCSSSPVRGPQRDFLTLKDDLANFEERLGSTKHDEKTKIKEGQTQGATQNFRSILDLDSLPENYHNTTKLKEKIGNTTISRLIEINKDTDNKTGKMVISEKIVTELEHQEGKQTHGCLVDEDCDVGFYCDSALFVSECRGCKTKAMECAGDGECCSGYLCVWGHCAEGVLRGEGGTTCSSQRDCTQGLCCLQQEALPFPVCSPLQSEGQTCGSRFTRLMDWGVEFEYPLEMCPCRWGLVC